jgi:hypothetical protein
MPVKEDAALRNGPDCSVHWGSPRPTEGVFCALPRPYPDGSAGSAGRAAATTAAVLVAASGATIATAPTASACNSAWYGLPGRITGSAVNLRSGPGTSHASKGPAVEGDEVPLLLPKAGQSVLGHVRPHKGIKGWVNGRYTKR